ncbi:MAG: diaminopimelate decarboxylase [Chloroflexota bacterium]
MTVSQDIPRLGLFPLTAAVNEKGHLTVGGCDTTALAEEFGTPLYIYDEQGLRHMCAEFRAEFGQRYADTAVLYASKAFINRAMARLMKEEGMGLDVVSGGEMGIVHSAGFPMERVYFHGNNKSAAELEQALDLGVGRIVVDNFHELALLTKIAGGHDRRADILLRLSPGVDPHTHRYNTTGIVDSKFGFLMSSWDEAIAGAMAAKGLNLVGLHFHLGSLIFEVEPYREAIGIVLKFAAGMKRQHGFELRELDIGGGYAAQYKVDEPAPPVSAYAGVIAETLGSQCRELGLPLPQLVIEPGRSIVARSGMALYRAGAIKDIPDVRRYVSVDGGMGDNIRYALYGARHEAILANRAAAANVAEVTISGKYCESGDVLIRDIMMPQISAGDIIAVADCGAYCLPMGSNYNAAYKPAVVLVREGKARLIRRRETLDDLTRCDVV